MRLSCPAMLWSCAARTWDSSCTLTLEKPATARDTAAAACCCDTPGRAATSTALNDSEGSIALAAAVENR